MQELLEQVPEEERDFNFCLRVAQGDVRTATEYFEEHTYSGVWRIYMHQVLYARQMNDDRP